MSKQQHHNADAHEYVIEFTKQSTKFFRKEEIGVVFCDRRRSYSRLYLFTRFRDYSRRQNPRNCV